jgi:hypothetical protein
LLNFIVANNLDILNDGNRPTFINRVRQEVLDITKSTEYVSTLIQSWHVSEVPSLSDHRHICFQLNAASVEFPPTNPRRTDWVSYLEDLATMIASISRRARNFSDIDSTASQLNDAMLDAYQSNCPIHLRSGPGTVTWWSKELEIKKRRTRRLFKRAKKKGQKHVSYSPVCL